MAEVSYGLPEGLPDASLLLDAAQRLVTIPEAAARVEAVQTIFKLIDAVLTTPEDPKKRRVRKANEAFHRKVGRHTAAIDFLRGAGFKDSNDPEVPGKAGQGALLMMPIAYLSRLTDAHQVLAQACQEAGMDAPPLPGGTFNPYRQNAHVTDTTRGPQVSEAWKSEADQLRDEVKKRQLELKQKVESAPRVELRPTAFWLAAGKRLADVVRETAAVPEDQPADGALLQEHLASVREASSGGTTGKFESADKRRLTELSQAQVCTTCILRVICPDKSVLQANFRAGDTGEHVLKQIEPLFAPHVQKAGWYIYQSPPLKRLVKRETLAAAGLTPGATLHLGFEDSSKKPGPPYLERRLFQQLGPPPKEAHEGVTVSDGSPPGLPTRDASGLSSSAAAPSSGVPVRTRSGSPKARGAAGGPKWFQPKGAVASEDPPTIHDQVELQDHEVRPAGGLFACTQVKTWFSGKR